MRKFVEINSVAAVMSDINIDTDAIIPKQFLKTIARSGLGKNLFFERRYLNNSKENPDFILNRKPWNKAKILIAGDNFGCGSSREHAPWALLDFGIECIISSSFADIFFNNSIKNGLLPLVLEKNIIIDLQKFAMAKESMKINLENKKLAVCDKNIDINLEENVRERLLKGLDDIELTMKYENDIRVYEEKQKKINQWKFINE